LSVVNRAKDYKKYRYKSWKMIMKGRKWWDDDRQS